MRVVLDTNVIVSGLLARASSPGRVLDAWEAGQFEAVSSPTLLAELTRVLARPRIVRRLGLSSDEVLDFLEAFRDTAHLVTPPLALRVVDRDPDDDHVIAAALASGAVYIVSGDADLLVLEEFQGTRILAAAEFVALLQAGLA